MGKVIKFPTRPEVAWSNVESVIRSWMASHGCSEDVIDRICISVKSHFMELVNLPEFSITLKIPRGLSSELEQELRTSLTESLQIYMNELIGAILTRIFHLEIQLYEANHRKE